MKVTILRLARSPEGETVLSADRRTTITPHKLNGVVDGFLVSRDGMLWHIPACMVIRSHVEEEPQIESKTKSK